MVSDSMSVNYTYSKHDKADKIKLAHRKMENGNLMVEAIIVDKSGNRVLDYENRVYFTIDGSGELMKNYGTPTRSQVIEMANGRAAIELIPGHGKSIIEVRNQDFKGSYIVIDPSKIKTSNASLESKL
jgi:beta-galactosidase